jgi:hypothetical protein
MATRSAIGYALPSGKVRAVYCHWDGSPSHQLPIDGSDYGDPPSTVTEADVEPHWRDYGCEHLYVFRPGYGWFHHAL